VFERRAGCCCGGRPTEAGSPLGVAGRPRGSVTGRAVPASGGVAEVDLVGVVGQPQLEELVQAVEEGSAGGGGFVGGSLSFRGGVGRWAGAGVFRLLAGAVVG